MYSTCVCHYLLVNAQIEIDWLIEMNHSILVSPMPISVIMKYVFPFIIILIKISVQNTLSSHFCMQY